MHLSTESMNLTPWYGSFIAIDPRGQADSTDDDYPTTPSPSVELSGANFDSSDSDSENQVLSYQSLRLFYADGALRVLQDNLDEVKNALDQLSCNACIEMGFDVLPMEATLAIEDDAGFFTGTAFPST